MKVSVLFSGHKPIRLYGKLEMCSAMFLCIPNKKVGKENLDQKRLSDPTKVNIGEKNDHGQR